MGCGSSTTHSGGDHVADRADSVDLSEHDQDDEKPSSKEFDASSRLRRRSMAVRAPASANNFTQGNLIAKGLMGITSKGKFTAPPDSELLASITPRSEGTQLDGTPGSSNYSNPMAGRQNQSNNSLKDQAAEPPALPAAKAVKLPCAIKEITKDGQMVQLALQCTQDVESGQDTESWITILAEVERQQQLLMRVTNPSVVETLGVTITGGTLRVASMYSVPLDDNDYKDFTASDVRGVLKDILTGLVGLHSHNLTHGNVKMSNVLGSQEESNMNEFLLVDGGYHPILNRIDRKQLWEVGEHCQGYYPPELLVKEGPPLHAGVIDVHKIDVWALGVLGYELVFGKPPFLEGDNADSTFRRIREHNVEIPVDYTRGSINVNNQLRECLLSLLEQDPVKRPTAVKALRHPLFHRGKVPFTSGNKLGGHLGGAGLGAHGRSPRVEGGDNYRDGLHHANSSVHGGQNRSVTEADFSAMSTRAMSMIDFGEANGKPDHNRSGSAAAEYSFTSGTSAGIFGNRLKPTQQENSAETSGGSLGKDDVLSPHSMMSEDGSKSCLTGFQRPLGEDDDDIVVIPDDIECVICRGPLPPVAYRCTQPHTSCRVFVICSMCHRGGVDPNLHDPDHPMSAVVVEEMDERKMSVALGMELGLSVLNRGTPQTESALEAEMISETGSGGSEATPYALTIDVTSNQTANNNQMGGAAGGGGAGAGAAMGGKALSSLGPNNTLLLGGQPKLKSKYSILVSSKSLTPHEQTVFGMTGQLPESKLDVAKKPTQGKCSLMSGFNATSGKGGKNEGVADDGFTVEDVMAECRGGKVDMNLHAMYLTKVPSICYDPPLPHMVELDLSSNNIAALPHEISFMTSLKKLLLGNNQLVVLPDSIGDLGELEVLEAHHNKLESIPQQLMFAEKLQTLSLDYNNLSCFPEVCFAMENLSTLYLASNLHITKWPAMDDLKQLPDIQIGLDNQPHLFSRFQTMQNQLPNVRVLWHKIYPDSIIPNLYCGSLRSAQTPLVYEALKIRHILTMGRGLEPYVEEGMKQKGIMVDDIPGANIEETFDEAIEFIDIALQQGEGCLVHCFAGMSRSATACIAYLMMRRGMRLDEAYVTVKRGRPAIYPNLGFFNQMLALDQKLYPNSRALDMDSMERDNVPLA